METDFSKVCDCCDATSSVELPEYRVNDPASRDVIGRRTVRLCSVCAATMISNCKYYLQPAFASEGTNLDLALGLVKALNALVECLGVREQFDRIMTEER